VDPDPDWIRIQRLVWIRIRIGNPDPDPGARKLRKGRGFFYTNYSYMTVFVRNAANLTLLLLKGSKLRKGNKN
jgi:hypothetical protein